MTPLPAWLHGLVEAVPPHVMLAVGAVLLAQRLARGLGMWTYALVALPGTFAHELAHWLVAHALRARPRVPDLWPTRTTDGWRLGSVAFQAPWWRAGPIALAPLLLLPASLLWMARLAAPAHGAAFVAHAWIAGTLLNASLLSRTDLRLALPVLALAAAGVLPWWLLGAS